MSARRIRCECGRVYEPAKHGKCPSCGTEARVATPEPPQPAEEEQSLVRQDDAAVDPQTEDTKPIAISGRTIAIAGAALLAGVVAVVALVRRGEPVAHQQTTQATPQPATAQQTALPTATAVASATPPPAANPVFPQAFDLPAAIAAAAPGATIKVPPGFYQGGLVVTKPVKLVSSGGQSWIQSDGRECLAVKAQGVSVQGMQFMCNGIGELPAISVTDGATGLGVSMTGNASLSAVGTNMTASGTALRMQGGKATLTQTTISDSKLGINASAGATLELKSCAFERDGTGDDKGGVAWGSGQGTNITVADSQFSGNYGGLYVSNDATLTISNSTFKDNGANAKVTYGVVAMARGGKATITNSTFDNNKQGVAVTERSALDMDQCAFSNNGAQTRQLVLETMPISVTGEGATANIRNTSIKNSVQFGIAMLNHGSAVIENVEIAGTKAIALAVGDTSSPPCQVEVRRSHLHHNQTGLGLYAGSTAKIEETEFRENVEGIMIGDRNTQAEMHKVWVNFSSERGLTVFNEARAVATESQFVGNARGAQSGMQRKSGGRASLTLEDCDVGENHVFGVGCYTNNELILRKTTFDDGNKQAIFKERGAIVQTDAAAAPADFSPPPKGGASPQEKQSDEEKAPDDDEAKQSATPSGKGRSKTTSRPRRTPRPEDEAARILRQIFRPR
jgi:hypothetical protein